MYVYVFFDNIYPFSYGLIEDLFERALADEPFLTLKLFKDPSFPQKSI